MSSALQSAYHHASQIIAELSAIDLLSLRAITPQIRERLYDLLESLIVLAEHEAFTPTPDRHAHYVQVCQRPLFICGSTRAGKTLLSSYLDGHPELVVLPRELGLADPPLRFNESIQPDARGDWFAWTWLGLICALPAGLWWPLDGGKGDALQTYVKFLSAYQARVAQLGQAHVTTAIHSYAYAVMSALGTGSEARMWVQESHYNHLYLREMKKHFPEGRFLFCIRDPIEIVQAVQDKALYANKPLNLNRDLALLKDCYDRLTEGQTLFDDASLYILNTDRLVQSPDETIADVLAWLGLQPDPANAYRSLGGQTYRREYPPEYAVKPLAESERRLIKGYLGASASDFGFEYPLLKYFEIPALVWKTNRDLRRTKPEFFIKPWQLMVDLIRERQRQTISAG